MDYVKSVGLGTLWHLYERQLQLTYCGMSLIGRPSHSTHVTPEATCPLCLEEASARTVGKPAPSAATEGKPENQQSDTSTGQERAAGEAMPIQQGPESSACARVDIEA
jgi:hypothetical protein